MMRISVSILVFFVLVGFVGFSFAATLVVNQTAPSCTSGSAYYSDLATAVTASASGDTIYICDGTYTEASISTTNSLNLYGYDYAGATISSTAASTSYALYLYGANTNITNISVTSPGGGIRVENTTACAFNKLNVTSTSASTSVAAITLSNATSCSITSVYTNASARAYSISLLAGSNNSIINRTTAMANGSSVYIYESGSISVLDSTIHSSAASASLYIRSSSNDLINNVTSYCGGNAAIYMYESTNNNVSNSSFSATSFYAVFLSSDCNNNWLYNNYFNGSASGAHGYVAPGLSNLWNTTNQSGTRIYSSGTRISGNYWTNSSGNGYSDTCTDADEDGFCDSSYTLAAGNIDYLPLAYVAPDLPLVVNGSSAACTSGSAYYSAIQSAINAASVGNTIIVCDDGIYSENLFINKSLNIYGIEAGVIVNATSSQYTADLAANYVNMSNFTFINAISGNSGTLYINNSNYTILSNINMTNSGDGNGLYLLRGYNNTIENVTILSTSWYALYAENSNYNSISNSTITRSSGGTAFLLSGSSFNNVNDTSISSTSYAINFDSNSNNNTFYGITATSTGAFSIYLGSGSNTSIRNSTLYTGYSGCQRGVNCQAAIYAHGTGNTFLNNSIYADYWVDGDETDLVLNDSASGNNYHRFNGIQASSFCNITSSTNTWADSGSGLPFNSSRDCLNGIWVGSGQDWHPWIGSPLRVVNDTSPTCTTSGTAYYSNISAAVSASSSGDTIIVCKGSTYSDNVLVDKPLNIYGNESTVNVTALSSGRPVFNITGNYVNISNFTIKGATSSSGFMITGSNATIQDSSFTNNYYGISLYSNSGNTISHVNSTASSGFALDLESSSNNVLSDLIMINTGSGMTAYAISLWSSSNNVIANSTVSGAAALGSAIYVYSGSNNTLSGLNVTNPFGYGVFLSSSSSNTILDVNSSAWEALYLFGSRNNISDSLLDGGLVVNPYGNITNCNNTVTNTNGSSGNPILFYGFQTGVVINGDVAEQIIFCNTNSSNISDTTVVSNNTDAIALMFSYFNSISGINADSGNYALSFSNSSNNNISDTNASGQSYAIHLATSSSNTFLRLNATANGTDAVYLESDCAYNNFNDTSMDGGFEFYSGNVSICTNNLTNVTGGTGKKILFYGNVNGVTLDRNDTEQILFCNTNNSIISNTNATSYGNSAIYIYLGGNNSLINISSNSTRLYGVQLTSTSNNNLTNVSASSVELYAIIVTDSINTRVINSTMLAGYAGCSYGVNCTAALAVDGAGSTFLNNTFQADVWVEVVGSSIFFNNSQMGNNYLLFNGTNASSLCNITSTTGSWANSGSDKPFNSSRSCISGRWVGDGQDWHPWAGGVAQNTTDSTPSSSDSDSSSSRTWPTLHEILFNCSTGKLEVLATEFGSPIPDLNIRLFNVFGPGIFDEQTDSDGKVAFIITSSGSYKLRSETTDSYFPAELGLLDLTLCQQISSPTIQPTVTPPTSPQNPPPSETVQNTNDSQDSQSTDQNQTQTQQLTTPTLADAQSSIAAASSAITDASRAGKNTAAAQEKLNEATAALASKDYARAKELADQAKRLALAALAAQSEQVKSNVQQSSTPAPSPREQFGWGGIIAGAAVLMVLVAVVYFLWARKKGKKGLNNRRL